MVREKWAGQKQYDRQRAAVAYREFRRRKDAVHKRLGGKCYICDRVTKSLSLHHLSYHPVESNYPRHSKSMSVRLKRVQEAEQNPTRFRLLCCSCHRLADALRRVRDVHGRLAEFLQ